MMRTHRCSMLGAWILLAAAGLSHADPDWAGMPYILHSDIQAVDADGNGTFALTSPVKMRGVIMHESQAMLDPAPGATPFLGGIWQVYVQAVDPGDFGGTAMWMGQNIGRIVGNHPAGSYTDAAWLAELDRLTHDPISGHLFAPGDLVEIRARAPGLNFRGKTNINEQHSNDPLANFDVVLLQADYGLPRPATVSIDELKVANNDFVFDVTRAAGCERYQGMLVRLRDIQFVDDAGWAPDAELLVTDGLLTFPVKLGIESGFSEHDAPVGPFDIIGILDQEDLDGSDGNRGGYRIWVARDYDGNGLIVPCSYADGDSDLDRVVDLDDAADFVDCLAGPGATPAPAGPITVQQCLDAFDFDADKDVDGADAAALQRRF